MSTNNNAAITPAQAAVTGSFRNTLGSTVQLTANADGSLTGVYSTGVGNATVGNVFGTWAQANNSEAILGWTVCWTNLIDTTKDVSVCSWTGRLRKADKIEIETTWILTSDTPAQDNWKANTINKDVFTKF